MKNTKAILKVPGTMEIRPAEVPVPKEYEVLIKVEYGSMSRLWTQKVELFSPYLIARRDVF